MALLPANKMKKLFGYTIEQLSSQLSEVIKYAVTKDLKHLHDEQIRVRSQLQLTANPAERKGLQIQEGVLATAIISKKVTNNG
jgi:hypothetical protein